MIEIRWKERNPKAAKLRELCAAVEEHRHQLLAEWEQKVLVTTPGPNR